MAMPTVKGRNASPAWSGEKSSTRWMYSVLKKNIAKRPEATRSMTTFAARSVRTPKMLRPDERLGRAALDHDERAQQDDGEREEAERLRRRPAVLLVETIP